MNYSEFLARDIFHAYVEFTSVKNAKENGLIPEKFHSIFPETCECGSDFIIKNNLKEIRCCNPDCYIKMAHRMSDMFTRFDCKNVKFKTCLSIVKYCINRGHFKVPTHTEILTVNFEDGDWYNYFGAKFYDIRNAVNKIKSSTLSLGSLISKLGIPSFGNDSEKYFSDIGSMIEIANFGSKERIREFLVSKGIYSNEKHADFIDNLMTIAIAEENLTYRLLPPSNATLKVVITGRVSVLGKYLSRNEYLDLCNKVTIMGDGGRRLYNVVSSKALASTDYFIADSPSTSEKYIAGLNREKLTGKKFIYTAEEFLAVLKASVDMYIERR